MPDQKAMDEARAFNAALDNALRTSGLVDRDLFLQLRDAFTYQAASTVGWVAAKLKVLRGRLGQGLPLTLYSPVANGQIVMDTTLAFEEWAESNFPGTLE